MFFPTISRRAKYEGAPGLYSYRKYKLEIVEDCQYRCVYCDGHGSSFGGHEMMELDHLRPKSANFFPHLKDEPTNLVLACRSCNGKKRDDWPAGTQCTETHKDGIGYIDPFQVNRTSYFTVDENGILNAIQNPANYMIEQLALNRPFAIAIRSRRIMRQKLSGAISELANALRSFEKPPTQEELKEIADLLDQANVELQNLLAED